MIIISIIINYIKREIIMEIRKFWMIPLFLLFILALGCVSASGDFDDVVSYNQSDNQITQSNYFNEDLNEQSSAGSSDEDDAGAGMDDNVLSSENSNENVGTWDGGEVLGATMTYKDLYDAIYANGRTAPAELTLQNDYVYDESRDGNMSSHAINIMKQVTIHGNGHTINGMGIFGHFVLSSQSSGNLIIDNLKLVNGTGTSNTNYAGSILVPSSTSLTATNCRFDSCSADFGGAIVASEGSSLSFTGCNFSNNIAMATTGQIRGGGAIYGSPNSITITNCVFTNNSAPYEGGAIAIKSCPVTIKSTTFSGNRLYGSDNEGGGAISFMNCQQVTLENSSFRNNNASVGAAFYFYKCKDVKIADSTLEANSASTHGIIYAALSNHFTFYNSTFADNFARAANFIILGNTLLNVTDSTFTGNRVDTYGAAIYLNQGPSAVIVGSRFSNNNAASFGGAISATSSNLNIIDSNFTGNKASSGGAIDAEQCTFGVEGSNFTENHAESFGGAIYSHNNTVFNVVRSAFNGNYITQHFGGAICTIHDSSVNISHSSFDGNAANEYGGAILLSGQNSVMFNNSFSGNHAFKGGAIFLDEGSQMTISKSNFTNQYADEVGGAIYSYNAHLTVSNAIFNHNTGHISDIGIFANQGLISDSDFMETNIFGNIPESGNKHFTPSAFTIDNIADLLYGNSITVRITESHGFTGTVNVTIGSNTYDIYINNGAGSRTISDLPVGTYKVILDFPQTGEYYSSYAESNEFRVRYNTLFTIASISDVVLGKPVLIDVTESNGYTGDVSVVIGSKSYTVSLLNGRGSISVDDLGVGSHKAVIDFQQNAEYAAAHAESNEFSVRYNSTLSIAAIPDAVLGESIVIDVTESNGYTGNVNLVIGSKSYTVSLTNGRGTKSVDDLGVGSHNAVIDLQQTGTYTSAHAQSNEFRVRYNTTLTIASISDVILGNQVLIDVTEANGYTGDVSVVIGSKSYTVSLANGRGTRSVDDLGVGSHKAVIDFQKNDEYAAAHGESNEFSVRYNSTLTIAAIQDSVLGESILIDVTEANGYSGDVSVVIGSKSYTVSLASGRGTKSVDDLGVGSHVAVVDLQQTDSYTSAHGESNEFRVRYNTTFAFASIPDAVLGEPVVVDVIEANGFTGDVSVVIGSKYYTVSLASGRGTKLIDDLGVGNYSAVIEFSQSGDYASAHGQSNLFKVRYQPEFAISQIPDSLYGDPIRFNITETHGMNATVKITLGSFEDFVELKNGNGSVKIDSLDVGVYAPLLNFTGSDTFTPATLTGNEFRVKFASFVDLNDVVSAGGNVELDRDYSFDGAYDMQFSNGIPVTRDVTINANGHVIDAKGLARIFDISNGAHVTIGNVTLSNGKAENGGAIRASADSVVTVINSSFDNNTAAGEGSAIYSQGAVNVNASSFINNPSSGGSGIYAGSGEISNSTIIGGGVSGNVHVSDDCVLMINPLFEIANIPDFVSGTSVTIRVSESHGLTGTVEVTIGDETYLVNVENGLGTRTVTPNVSFGKYTANLRFNMTKDYYSATAKSNQFQVSVNPEIQIADIADAEKGKAITIKLTANRLFTGKVSVNIGGASYSVDVAGGEGSITVTPDLKAGEYRAAVTYSGNENYTAANAESNAFRIYYTTQIVSNDVTAVYNGGQYLYVTLKDSDGNAVSGVGVKIEIANAKTLTPLTDSNGQVRIPINGISPNTYTARITFAGNALYAQSAKSVKVIVKKATPKLTASKKTFKKSVKVKKYTITLKDNNGKAMSNVKVTIKIKNKSFTTKVNKKGKATFKITKFKKKGKFTAIVTFKGNAFYNKVSKKVKITIK